MKNIYRFLSLVPGTGLQKLLECPELVFFFFFKCLCYANKVAYGGPLGSARMEVVYGKMEDKTERFQLPEI